MKYAVFGASGRMGTQLAQVGRESGNVPAVGFYHKNQPKGYERISNSLDSYLVKSIDCLIDFSLPVAFKNHISFAVENNKPLVSGVTGIEETQIIELYQAAKTIPVLWSPNFSLGICLFKSFLAQCARLRNHFDFQIEEIHHTQKKDAPSGTAKYLQETLKKKLPPDYPLPEPIAIRGGGIIGEHSLRLFGKYETITIEHSARDRKLFALGALEVANWLITQQPGFYSMDDFFEKNL